MLNRSWYLSVCATSALLLTIAETGYAQFVTFPIGRGGTGVFAPRGVGFFPSYYGSPYYGSPYYRSPYYGSPIYTPNYGGYNPSFYGPGSNSYYSVTTTTPLYYGAAGYATAYSPARVVSPSQNTLTTIDRASSAAYSPATYPLRTPEYNVIYPDSRPASQPVNNTAEVEVRVPSGAKLYFDGRVTNQTGSERSFTTPALEPNQDYVYEVQASWNSAGKPVEQTRKVTVHAGDHVVVDFQRD